MARVLVLGNAGLDISLKVSHLPQRGETLLGDTIGRAPGGKGLNQAVAIARAGARTLFLAPTGDDGMAGEIRTILADEANLCFEQETMPGATDFSLLMVLPDGENSIVSAGPSAAAFPPEAAAAFANKAEASDIFLVQGNLSFEATLLAMKTARTRGARTVLNPAPVWWDAAPLIPHCDILVVNRGEAEMLGGSADPLVAATQLADLGTETVIITLGGEGCLIRTAGETKIYDAVPVDVVDTTGCGDTFCGALSAALSLNISLEKAVEFAQAAAAITATRAGAFAALPSRAELAALRGTEG